MKAIKIITHPVLLIISFLFILISGKSFGGFYMLYLLLALPHGGAHSLVAVAGILLLVFGLVRFKRENKYIIEAIINIIGAACLVISLFVFFNRDKSGYNEGTFEQFAPQMTLLLFGLIVLSFALFNIIRSLSKKPTNGNLSMTT